MKPIATIIICSYNQHDFLREAVRSALQQTVPVDVVVADDCSDINPATVIDELKDPRVHYIGRGENIGQTGNLLRAYVQTPKEKLHDIVMFLDGDDVLEPHCIERIAANFDPAIHSKIQYQLTVIDAEGKSEGHVFPRYPAQLSTHQIRDDISQTGTYMHPPSCGSTFSKRFLDQGVCDKFIYAANTPQGLDRNGGLDAFLSVMAGMCGTVKTLREPLARYRVHGGNACAHGATLNMEAIRDDIAHRERTFHVVKFFADHCGFSMRPDALERDLWMQERWLTRDALRFRHSRLKQFLRAVWGSQESLRSKAMRSLWGAGVAWGGKRSADIAALRFCASRRPPLLRTLVSKRV